MMRRGVAAPLALLTLACHPGPVPPVASTPAPRAAIVGVWRVVRFCDDDATGKLYEPFGPRPTGLFVYAPGGQLSIQIGATPPPSSPLALQLTPSGTVA